MAAEDENAKVIIITGAGGRAFVAGADISAMQMMTAEEAYDYARLGQTTYNKIQDLPKIVIAAIDGFALGGGCELALACDIRVASEKSQIGIPEVTLGVFPGFAGTQRLPEDWLEQAWQKKCLLQHVRFMRQKLKRSAL